MCSNNIWGKKGCYNLRLGGDTVHEDKTTESSRFCTYVVYRSFKYPPPVPPLNVSRWNSWTPVATKSLSLWSCHSLFAQKSDVWSHCSNAVPVESQHVTPPCQVVCLVFAEASCASVIRTAQNIVSDFGEASATAKSSGLLPLSKRNVKNSERDCSRLLGKKYQLTLPVTKTFLKTKKASMKIPFLRIRHWVEFLMKNNCLHILAGLMRPNEQRQGDIWEAWWKNFKCQHPQHPIFERARLGEVSLRKTLPLLLHGDEGRSRKRSAFLIVNVHSPLGRGIDTGLKHNTHRKYLKMLPNFIGHSYTNRFLLSAVHKSHYVGSNSYVFDLLMENTAKELEFMYETGVSHNGERYHAVCVGIVGDWPWLQKSGSLQRSFMNVPKKSNAARRECKGICHICSAGKSPDWPYEQLATRHPDWKDSVLLEPPFDEDQNHFRTVPHVQGELPLLWKFDIFHCIHLGVAKNFLGSLLACLSELEPAGAIDSRFELLSSKYLSWCASNKRAAHCQRITKEHLNWVSTTYFPSGTWHKGDLSTSLLLFCEARFLAENWDGEMLRLAGEAVVALNACLKLLYHGEAWLCQEDAWRGGQLGLKFLRRYGQLANLAHNQNRKLWVVMPKHHAVHHIFLQLLDGSSRGPVQNPIVESVQQDEDFIGRGSRLSRHVSPMTCEEKTVDRYLMSCYSKYMASGYLVGAQGWAKSWNEFNIYYVKTEILYTFTRFFTRYQLWMQ